MKVVYHFQLPGGKVLVCYNEAMKYYLSSYKLGNETEKLKEMLRETSGKFVYCPNALDFTSADPERRQSHIEKDMDDLRALGVDIEAVSYTHLDVYKRQSYYYQRRNFAAWSDAV